MSCLVAHVTSKQWREGIYWPPEYLNDQKYIQSWREFFIKTTNKNCCLVDTIANASQILPTEADSCS